MLYSQTKKRKSAKVFLIIILCIVFFGAISAPISPAFAGDDDESWSGIDTSTATEDEIELATALDSIIDITATIIQAIGVIFTVYSIGQLVLAFKNEDTNAKTKSSTLLAVGIVLIAMPGIVKALNISQYIT